MEKSELEQLSNTELQKKAKSTKILIGVLITLLLFLLFFWIRDYFIGNGFDIVTLTIIICLAGGLVTLFPELKLVKKEINNRN